MTEELIASVERFLVPYWFEEHFFQFNWPSLPVVGLQMYSRSPSLDDDSLRSVRSMGELEVLPGWLPISAGATEQVYNFPDTAQTIRTLRGAALLRLAKTVDENSQTIGLVQKDGVPAIMEDYAGWVFSTGRAAIEQETVSLAVLYLVGEYFGVVDPIIIFTTQGLLNGNLQTNQFAPEPTVLRGGSLYGMATYADDILPSLIRNTYSVGYRNIVARQDIRNGIRTITTQSKHNFVLQDLVYDEVRGATPSQGYSRVINIIDLYTYQVATTATDSSYVASANDATELYVALTTNTFTSGTTLLRLPPLPFESTNVAHVWMKPQRMNMVANPSFEDSTFGWQVGLTGSQTVISVDVIDDDGNEYVNDVLLGGSASTTTSDIVEGGSASNTTLDVISGGTPGSSTSDTVDGQTPGSSTSDVIAGGDPSAPSIGSTDTGTIDGGDAFSLASSVITGDTVEDDGNASVIIDGNTLPGQVHTGFLRVLGGVDVDRPYCGQVSGNGAGRLILESNLFPIETPRMSVSCYLNGSGTARIGVVAWDRAYRNPTYIYADDFVVNADTVGPTGDFAHFTSLIPALPQTAEYNLRIEWTPTDSSNSVFYIDNVLVDPNDSQYDYFDGASTTSFIEDYRWHGGYANRHFSLWYNNYHNTKARLLGGTDDEGVTYKNGLLDEWTPSGAGIIPHWEAITGSPLSGWVGDYFYPITDAKPVLLSPHQEYNLQLRPRYPNAVLDQTGNLIRDGLGDPILINTDFRSDVVLTYESGSPLTTEDGSYLLVDTAP